MKNIIIGMLVTVLNYQFLIKLFLHQKTLVIKIKFLKGLGLTKYILYIYIKEILLSGLTMLYSHYNVYPAAISIIYF